MIKSIKALILLFLFVFLTAVSYAGEIISGDTKPLGNGTVTSWIKLGDDGKPQSIGITLTDGALNGLPGANDKGSIKLTSFPEISTFEYVLSLPKEAALTPFNHISINWNPTGHPPECYGVQHFDFHFNMETEQEREAITDVGIDTLKVY